MAKIPKVAPMIQNVLGGCDSQSCLLTLGLSKSCYCCARDRVDRGCLALSAEAYILVK